MDIDRAHEPRLGGSVGSPAVQQPRMGEYDVASRARQLLDAHRDAVDPLLHVHEARDAVTRATLGGQLA
jgi:hypothetical protein